MVESPEEAKVDRVYDTHRNSTDSKRFFKILPYFFFQAGGSLA
jgi:hypothetical protein